MPRIILIVHNVRSAHNVGSILRSADGFGAEEVYLTGYTPYPIASHDSRLPHIAKRTSARIAKTALGAENTVSWHHEPDIITLLGRLKERGCMVAALEQTPASKNLADFRCRQPVALVVGSETSGLEKEVLRAADVHLLIPMLGAKESYNVAAAAAVALYHLRWYNQTSDDRQNKNGFTKIRPPASIQAKRHKR